MEYHFEDDFLEKNKTLIKTKERKCNINFNLRLRKSLDSLFILDQKYRKLSGGNYEKYKKELTEGDSIASTNLLKLIKEYGFPNEYDLGLSSSNKMFFHQFYYIIWHQLAGNLYSSQKINFSEELLKALNKGKITPNNGAFLIDLNNGLTPKYTSHIFSLHQFVKINDNFNENNQQLNQNMKNVDCCYITSQILPEKRNDFVKSEIQKLDENRERIGLGTIEKDIKKNLFYLKNKEFIFSNIPIIGHAQSDQKEIDNWKKRLQLMKVE